MDNEQLFNVAKQAINHKFNRQLRDVEAAILRGALENKTYADMTRSVNWAIDHLKQEGSQFWAQLSEALGQKVTKTNFREVLISRLQLEQSQTNQSQKESEVASSISENPNFVGREDAIAHLDQLRHQGEKLIVIQGMGGVGKTRLAEEYLTSQGFDLVLELRMVKKKEGIATVESVIEEWFRRDLQEEPGQELGVMLARLKRQLQTRKIGVLIDNLETALDGQGRFETDSGYVHLLSVLADSTLKSFTLIASREPLGESIDFATYMLPSLNQQAWQEFFSSRQINVDDKILNEMHKAYDGNALAMKLLCEPINRNEGMANYWRKHKVENGIVIELAVENLVKDQFNRLEKICPEAYHLLCRLGCYRYQDLATVPRDGLSCLMWDVPKNQLPHIIKFLEDRCLVECQQEEYYLHPFICLEAITRLRNNQEDWKTTNHEAAKYWTKAVKTVETEEQAIKALEPYYHYIQIEDFNSAAEVIITGRTNKWIKGIEGELLGQSFYRLGILEGITSVIELLIQNSEKINNAYLGKIYYILGSVGIIKGNLNEAMKYFSIAKEIAMEKEERKPLRIDIGITIGFCQKYMGELEEAIKTFQEVLEIIGEDNTYRADTLCCWSLLAFLYSSSKEQDSALHFAAKVDLEEFFQVAHRTIFRKGSALLYLGSAYENLRNFEEASKIYKRTKEFAEDANCKQIIAKALNGLAEIEREQGNFKEASIKHEEAIKIALKGDAKGYLAEAYYQQGLTYQKMGELEQSKEDFQKAIELYDKMKVPKQVEKVQRAMKNGV